MGVTNIHAKGVAMKKRALKIAGVFLCCMTLGVLVGISSPTSVSAGPGPSCILIQQCFDGGTCGSCSQNPCERNWRITSLTNSVGNCCGSVISSGCSAVCTYPCPGCSGC